MARLTSLYTYLKYHSLSTLSLSACCTHTPLCLLSKHAHPTQTLLLRYLHACSLLLFSSHLHLTLNWRRRGYFADWQGIHVWHQPYPLQRAHLAITRICLSARRQIVFAYITLFLAPMMGSRRDESTHLSLPSLLSHLHALLFLCTFFRRRRINGVTAAWTACAQNNRTGQQRPDARVCGLDAMDSKRGSNMPLSACCSPSPSFLC